MSENKQWISNINSENNEQPENSNELSTSLVAVETLEDNSNKKQKKDKKKKKLKAHRKSKLFISFLSFTILSAVLTAGSSSMLFLGGFATSKITRKYDSFIQDVQKFYRDNNISTNFTSYNSSSNSKLSKTFLELPFNVGAFNFVPYNSLLPLSEFDYAFSRNENVIKDFINKIPIDPADEKTYHVKEHCLYWLKQNIDNPKPAPLVFEDKNYWTSFYALAAHNYPKVKHDNEMEIEQYRKNKNELELKNRELEGNIINLQKQIEEIKVSTAPDKEAQIAEKQKQIEEIKNEIKTNFESEQESKENLNSKLREGKVIFDAYMAGNFVIIASALMGAFGLFFFFLLISTLYIKRSVNKIASLDQNIDIEKVI